MEKPLRVVQFRRPRAVMEGQEGYGVCGISCQEWGTFSLVQGCVIGGGGR